MDGRFTETVTHFLRQRLNVDHVNLLTGPGPVAGFADGEPDDYVAPILRGVRLSVESLGVRSVAIMAHQGCLGNPADDAVQRRQLFKASEKLERELPGVEILPLWVKLDGAVEVLQR